MSRDQRRRRWLHRSSELRSRRVVRRQRCPSEASVEERGGGTAGGRSRSAWLPSRSAARRPRQTRTRRSAGRPLLLGPAGNDQVRLLWCRTQAAQLSDRTASTKSTPKPPRPPSLVPPLATPAPAPRSRRYTPRYILAPGGRHRWCCYLPPAGAARSSKKAEHICSVGAQVRPVRHGSRSEKPATTSCHHQKKNAAALVLLRCTTT